MSKTCINCMMCLKLLRWDICVCMCLCVSVSVCRYGEAYSWQYVNCCVHNIIVGKIWIEHVSRQSFCAFCATCFFSKMLVGWLCYLFIDWLIDWLASWLTDLLIDSLLNFFLFIYLFIHSFICCYFPICCAVWHNGSYESQVFTEVGCQLQSLRMVR